MAVLEEIKRNHKEMVSWRRDLHAHPELGFAGTRTSTFIQERAVFRRRRGAQLQRNRSRGSDSRA